MISGHDLYTVLTAVVPLYAAVILGYGSVRWWKIFNADQCSGISRFVAMFAIPLLGFELIHSNNPYAMDFRFIAADALQKVAIVVVLGLWTKFAKSESLDWMITIYSLSTLPNTLIVGVPLLVSMYGEFSGSLMVQVVVMQGIVWNNVLLFLYEYRAAKMLATEKIMNTAASIASFKVESDVVSLEDPNLFESGSEIGDDGMLRKANFVDCSGISSVPESRRPETFGGAVGEQSGRSDCGAKEIRIGVAGEPHIGENKAIPDTRSINGEHINFDDGSNNKGKEDKEMKELHSKAVGSHDSDVNIQMPPTSIRTSAILITVWRKLIRNPNTCANIFGLICALITFRLNVTLPAIVEQSISIISNTGLGMAMFSLGLFIALQPKMISCGMKAAAFSMIVRFFIGPAVMAVTSMVIGIRGTLLQVAIVQATLPQAIITFVYAKEYNVFPSILSTGVIFGMFISLPITLVYYIVLRL
ncbi:Peptidyl-prolyl cis-trans isomerase pin4 [Sarracenia purpurea var. burkii]